MIYLRINYKRSAMTYSRIHCFFLICILVILSGCHHREQPSSSIDKLDNFYNELRLGYGKGDTAKAESIIKQMLSIRYSPDEKERYIRLLNNGLLQWMYTYIYSESPASGFRRFQSMANGTQHAFDLPKESHRKLLVLSAYLGMQSGDITRAVSYIERALKLPGYPTPDERYADYTFAGAIYSQAKGKVNRSIEMYEKASKELKQSTDQSGLPWVLGNLAELYEFNGRFEDAIRMYYQALSYFQTTGDNEGAASVYYSLAQLYRHLDMWEEAEQYANKGIEHAYLSKHTYTIGLLLLEKYKQAYTLKQIAAAHRWLISADSCFSISENPVDHLSAQAAMAQLLLQDSTRSDEAIRRMEEIAADTLISQSPYFLIISAELAKNYLRQEQTEKGLSLIQSVLPKLETDKREVILQEVYQSLAAHFRSRNDHRQEALWLNKEIKLRDELFESAKMRHVAAYRIRYETGRKELENEILQQEMLLKERTLIYTGSVSGLLILLLIGAGIYYRQRQMYHRKQSELRLSQISALLNSQSKLQQHTELLEYEIKQKQRTEPKKNIIMPHALAQRILSQSEEMNFRRSFTERFPNYLPTLRNRCPDLTRMDELIAMLLLLDQSNDEIALALNITRGSVNKARSRMRKRLGLVETGVVLEKFLKEIAGQTDHS